MSWEVPEGRLAFDLPNIDGHADLLLDLHREGRADRQDPGEVAGIRLLQVLQRLVAPLEERPSADPPHAAEGDQLKEFLLDAVLHLNGESRERSDLLLVEDPAEFAHRVEEPLRLIRHPADVSGADPELLRDLLLRPLRDPVVEEGGRLDLCKEEVVVLDREREIRFLDFLLYPRIVAAAQIELGHVRGRADGPEVEETIVAGLVERVAHLDRTERIDIQIARPLPKEGGSKEAVVSSNEILFLQKIEDLANLAVDLGDFTRESVECPVEECKEIFLRVHVTGRHARKDMHPESGFRSQFRFDCLRLAEEIFLNQIVDLVNVLREQDGLAILVVLWAPRPAAHLLDLKDGNWCESEVDVVPVQVPDNHPASGEVNSGRKGGSCDDGRDPSLLEFLFDYRTLGVREPCVVKRDAVPDAVREAGRHRGRLVLYRGEARRDLPELLAGLFAQFLFHRRT